MTTNQFFSWWSSVVKSLFSQVTFCENLVSQAIALTFFSSSLRLGRLLFIALAVASPRIACAGIVGVVASYAFSLVISENTSLRSSGIFTLNGWYLGLACATFFPGNVWLALILLGLTPVSVTSVIIFDRFLRLWNLPQLVMPYVTGIWVLQILSWVNPAAGLTVSPILKSGDYRPFELVLLGSLKSFGQIFFLDNIAFSAVVLVILAWSRVLPFWVLLCGPLIASYIAFLVVGLNWIISSGLAGFGAILLGAAFHAKFVTPSRIQLAFLFLISGLLEVVAIEVGSFFHLFALSGGYIFLMWITFLLTETSQRGESHMQNTLPW